VILVIDTSSSVSALATIDGRRATILLPARSPELLPQLRRLASENKIEKVAVATGPGSFTGLRVGVSFGLGLAMGLRIPIVPLPTLELQAARGHGKLTAVSEAGRGRFYYLPPGGHPSLGTPEEIPHANGLVGLLSAKTRAELSLRGLVVADDGQVLGVADAAEKLLKSAHEVPYESVKLEYMQSFGARL